MHYDVIVAAQNAGILPSTPNGVIESEFYSSSPPSLDAKTLFDELDRVRITTGSSAPASDVIEELWGQPVGCDVSVLRDFHSCREGVHVIDAVLVLDSSGCRCKAIAGVKP